MKGHLAHLFENGWRPISNSTLNSINLMAKHSEINHYLISQPVRKSRHQRTRQIHNSLNDSLSALSNNPSSKDTINLKAYKLAEQNTVKSFKTFIFFANLFI
jgi:hypothetical protein